MSSQRTQSDSFRFKRAAFYNGLKSKVGLAAAKAAALRVNLNVQGCGMIMTGRELFIGTQFSNLYTAVDTA